MKRHTLTDENRELKSTFFSLDRHSTGSTTFTVWQQSPSVYDKRYIEKNWMLFTVTIGGIASVGHSILVLHRKEADPNFRRIMFKINEKT